MTMHTPDTQTQKPCLS